MNILKESEKLYVIYINLENQEFTEPSYILQGNKIYIKISLEETRNVRALKWCTTHGYG
jgi:hypothetical protein